MPAKIIDGKALREQILARVEADVKQMNKAPHLLVVAVGDDMASEIYIRNKERACRACGIKFSYRKFAPCEVNTNLLCNYIKKLAEIGQPDGIIVQLPLPNKIDTEKVKLAIPPELDVDGFHPMSRFHPCTPRGILTMIESTGYEIAGKHAVVIGRSNIVGRPLAKLLLDEDATVTVCHSHTKNLSEITITADILISAVGKPGFVKSHMVRPGAMVIDVGINRDENGKVCGDVCPSVAGIAGWITPVPGGVGCMTVATLMQNVAYARVINWEED